MKTNKIPPLDFLNQCFDYNEETGIIVWKYRPISHFASQASQSRFNKLFAGNIAGSNLKTHSGKTYIKIMINNINYSAHRIAWAIANGSCDEEMEIDHINGNGTDNKISNLRLVSNIENGKNRKLYKTNSSGVSGVVFRKDSKKWRATISINGKKINLGSFISMSDAIKARKLAENYYCYHDNHGCKRPL